MQKKIDSSLDIIVREAKRRGIEVMSFPDVNPGVVRLTYRGHPEFVYYSSTNQLGRVTFKIFVQKPVASAWLREGGFPVPEEIFTDDLDEIRNFLKQHERIVIKPFDSVWGQGVTPGLTQAAELKAAVELAQSFNASKHEKRVVCQRHVTGEEFRILVIDQKNVFAVRRIPAHVMGDGIHTIKRLIGRWNGKVAPARVIEVTEGIGKILDEQGMNLESVPKEGQQVFLMRVANAHAGGTVHDATDLIGGAAKQTAIEVAKYFDVPVVGVDCISPDIAKEIGFIIELNSTPDLTLHHFPTVGEPRNPARALVDMLFPETKK